MVPELGHRQALGQGQAQNNARLEKEPWDGLNRGPGLTLVVKLEEDGCLGGEAQQPPHHVACAGLRSWHTTATEGCLEPWISLHILVGQ